MYVNDYADEGRTGKFDRLVSFIFVSHRVAQVVDICFALNMSLFLLLAMKQALHCKHRLKVSEAGGRETWNCVFQPFLNPFKGVFDSIVIVCDSFNLTLVSIQAILSTFYSIIKLVHLRGL